MPTTQYMQLALPQPSVTPGPVFASMLNQAFVTLDQHSHVPGFGAPVPAAGINIDRALSFNGFDAVSLRSVRLANQPSPLSLGTDIGCLYCSAGALWFNNGAGQAVQITAGAALNGASLGAVGGDYSTSGASEVYVSASTTFQFFQAANKYASLDAGNVTLRQPGATSPQGVTLKSPTSLAASYSLTLLTALPAGQSFLTVDVSGNLAAGVSIAGGITSSMVGTLARSNLPALGQQVSSSSGISFSTTSTTPVDVTGLSVTLATTGRPVMVAIQDDGSGNAASFGSSSAGSCTLQFLRDGSVIGRVVLMQGSGLMTSPCVFRLDTPGAGSHTYTVRVTSGGGGGAITVTSAVLVAYEL